MWFAPTELHVFDVEFLDYTSPLELQPRTARERIETLTTAAVKRGVTPDAQAIETILREAADFRALQGDPQAYGEYFANVYRKLPDLKLVGGKTPFYMELGASHWSVIRQRLISASLDPYVIVSFRDPVERPISHFLMMKANRFWQAQNLRPTDPDAVLAWMLHEQQLRRVDYRSTVEALRSAFPDDRVQFVLIEERFTEKTMRDMMRFLGVDYVEPNCFYVRNGSTWSWDCPDGLRTELRRRFDDTYVFSREWFGEERIQRLWQNT